MHIHHASYVHVMLVHSVHVLCMSRVRVHVHTCHISYVLCVHVTCMCMCHACTSVYAHVPAPSAEAQMQ